MKATASRTVRPDDWYSGIFGIYDRMRAHRFPYNIVWRDKKLLVYPDVYAPQMFTDSFWFADVLPDVVGKRSLLEIGTGSGIIAISCALNGASVIATDINPDSCRNAKANCKELGVNVRVLQGDLYAPLLPTDQFDFIFWAHPFNNSAEPLDDPLLMTGFDHEYRAVKRYIAHGRMHLKPGGRLFLGTGDSADVKTLLKLAEASGYQSKIVKRITLPLEYGGVDTLEYRLYEFSTE